MKKLFLYTLLILVSACESDDSNPSLNEGSISGSYSRMLTYGDRLYIIDQSKLSTLDISDVTQPIPLSSQEISDDVETLFFNGNYLFIGSQSGLFIYGLDENGVPEFESITPYTNFQDALPCDPAVANDTHAFVTLTTRGFINEGGCSRIIQLNQLRIYDFTNVEEPIELSRTDLFGPKGLGLNGERLFVCDNGLKLFDVSNPVLPLLLDEVSGFESFDVIPLDDLVIVVGPEGLYQFDYSDLSGLSLLSEFIF